MAQRSDSPEQIPLDAALSSGLVTSGAPLLVMLSGGADSICLFDVCLRLGADVSALHIDYGLRAESGADAEHCRALCARRGVPLTVESVALPASGNLQALARDARYQHAESIAKGDYAAAHTASDEVETIVYRLATSPGRRALLGIAPRRGRLVRPLLTVTREQVRDYCRARSLEWREDASNSDHRFARARVRSDVLPALRSLGPAVDRTLVETAAQLREESELLDATVEEALVGLGGGPAVSLSDLATLGPALARLTCRRLAERVTEHPHALRRADVDALIGRADDGGSRTVELGGGLTAVVEYGVLRFRRAGEAESAPALASAQLEVPGRARFGDWVVEAVAGERGEAILSGARLSGPLYIRGWRDGDRMRPLGLGGTKTLQDIFTDRKIPRALRRTLPVVEVDGAIAWVAGVAVDERFAAAEDESEPVGLSARPASG